MRQQTTEPRLRRRTTLPRVALLSVYSALLIATAYRPIVRTTEWQAKVQLVAVNHAQWQRELAALRGRVVVVDHWATWCVPCIERFPHMMAMARKWSPRGVVFVTLSLDDRDDPATLKKVVTFLRSQNARVPNFLMDEITPDAFEKLGLLSVPAVIIYDRSGKVAYRLTGDDPNHQFTDADVEKAVSEIADKAR